MHNHGADDVYGANTTMEPTYGGNSGIRGHDARAGDRDAAMLAGQGQGQQGVNDRDFAMAGNGGQGGYGQGQGQGYNDASNMGGGGGRGGMGMQGGGDYATSNERGMGGQVRSRLIFISTPSHSQSLTSSHRLFVDWRQLRQRIRQPGPEPRPDGQRWWWWLYFRQPRPATLPRR